MFDPAPDPRPALRAVPRSTPVDRPVPADLASEQAVLGAVLNDRDLIIRLAGRLTPADFFYDAHRAVYTAMVALYRHTPPTPPDCLTVAGELTQRGILEQCQMPDDPTAVGKAGLAYLFHLRQTCLDPWHVDHYAARVADVADERRLISVGGQIAGLGYERGTPVADRLAAARQLLAALTRESTTADEWAPLGSVVSAYLDKLGKMDGALSGLSTGLDDLDDATDGLQRGDLIVVTAPTSGGKSALGLALCLAAARAGKRVGVVSLEMSRDQYCQRILAHESRIDGAVLRTGRLDDREWQTLSDVSGRIAPWSLFLNARKGQTLDDILDSCYRFAGGGAVDLLLVDYMQLVNRRGLRAERDDLALDMIAGGLKELAGQLDCPLVTPSQENEAGATRGSKGISFAADLVIGITADLDPRTLNPLQLVPTDLVLSKQRNGGKGVVSCLWDLRTNRFLPATSRRA